MCVFLAMAYEGENSAMEKNELADRIEKKSEEDFEFIKRGLKNEKALTEGIERAKDAFVEHYTNEPMDPKSMNAMLKNKYGQQAPRIHTDNGFTSFFVSIPNGLMEYISPDLPSVKRNEKSMRQACIGALENTRAVREKIAKEAERNFCFEDLRTFNENVFKAAKYMEIAMDKAPKEIIWENLAETVSLLTKALDELKRLGFNESEKENEDEM